MLIEEPADELVLDPLLLVEGFDVLEPPAIPSARVAVDDPLLDDEDVGIEGTFRL